MSATVELKQAIATEDWDAVMALLDEGFYRYLFASPELLREAFSLAPPAWYVAHPRNVMSRAIVAAVPQRDMIVEDEEVAMFRDWVQNQDEPAIRDVLGLQQASLRQLLAHGWYQDASTLADEVLASIRTAPARGEGLHDVLPSVLVRCGTAKLFAGDLTAAATCYSEAVRWSTRQQEHPFAPYARGHLALAHALEERYAEAASLLEDHPAERSVPGTIQHHYEPAIFLAGLLVATASADRRGVDGWLSRIDQDVLDGEFGWVALHAQAQAALTQSSQWSVIHALNTRLAHTGHRAHVATIAGAFLRGDLAALHQSTGDLRAAERALADSGSFRNATSAIIPLARQALLRGQPHQAIALLRVNEAANDSSIPARYTPTGAVLYATAELAASNQIEPFTLEFAATAVTHHRAYGALANASPELRTVLDPLIDVDTSQIATPWVYRSRVKLTPREREILSALRSHSTINRVAAALHVSPNTAKTHVRSLYKKLGAHTRDEALWLGDR